MLKDLVRSFIRENSLIPKGSLVVSAFSGGADSLLMTLLLKELQEELSFELCLVHVNHHIRGAAADSDADFAKEFAKKEGLFLTVIDVDPVEYSRTHSGVSIEEAARILRFEAIGKEISSRREDRAVSVAVAHHIERHSPLLHSLQRQVQLPYIQPLRRIFSGLLKHFHSIHLFHL